MSAIFTMVAGGAFVATTKSQACIDGTSEVCARFTLPDDARFKVKIDTKMVSGHNKKNDIVQFSVLEDVYGTVGDKRVVVIPKDTIGFGRVYQSKGPTLFYIGGRAKIRVELMGIKLSSGQVIKVDFAVPDDPKRSQNTDSKYIVPSNVVPCGEAERSAYFRADHFVQGPDAQKTRMCVEGRRDRVPLGSAVATAIIGTAVGVVTRDAEKTAFAVGTETFLDKANGTSAVGSLLDGLNAVIEDGSIFEVVPMNADRTRGVQGFILVKKPE